MKRLEKRVLIIVPPFFKIEEDERNRIQFKRNFFSLPYGVLSMAAYVNKYSKNAIKFHVLDLNIEVTQHSDIKINTDSLIKDIVSERIKSFQPEIVGISALIITCYNYLKPIIETVKSIDKNQLLIVGGGLASNCSTDILNEFPSVDAICHGEGEIPLCQLLDAENGYDYLENSCHWSTHQSIKMGRVPQNTFVKDLDTIPFFDYSLIDLNLYTGRALDKFRNSESNHKLNIHTSRGCPFNCVFCACSSIHGKQIRYMSVEKVISEIENMVKLFKIKTLDIEDDHFLSDKNRAKRILKEISNFDLKIDFPSGVAVYAVDDEIGKLLKEAGASVVTLAVESGSDFVLKKIIDKPYSKKMIAKAVNSLRNNGINVHCFIVSGLPGELEEHRKETMKMLIETGFDWVYFFVAIPLPGSRLYEICKANNYLVKTNFGDYDITKCNIKSPEIDPKQMEERVYLMNLEANFVNNHNIHMKNYQKASQYLSNVIANYPDHAFAHYYLAKASEGLGKSQEDIDYHREKFIDITRTNQVWKQYAEQFGLI